MINIYVARDPGDLLLKAGRPAANIDKALERAKKLRAHRVEVRDDALHYTNRLQAIFAEGVRVAA